MAEDCEVTGDIVLQSGSGDIVSIAVESLTASGYPPTGAWPLIYADAEPASSLFSGCGFWFLISIPAEDSDLWMG